MTSSWFFLSTHVSNLYVNWGELAQEWIPNTVDFSIGKGFFDLLNERRLLEEDPVLGVS